MQLFFMLRVSTWRQKKLSLLYQKVGENVIKKMCFYCSQEYIFFTPARESEGTVGSYKNKNNDNDNIDSMVGNLIIIYTGLHFKKISSAIFHYFRKCSNADVCAMVSVFLP